MVQYIKTETVCLAFFDDRVSVKEKRKMVLALNNNFHQSYCRRPVLKFSDVQENLNLHCFVCQKPQDLFRRYGISKGFLKDDTSSWQRNQVFTNAQKFLSELCVVNDFAERKVAVAYDYRKILPKDPTQKH